jgi:ATP-dependent DNA helicase RecG
MARPPELFSLFRTVEALDGVGKKRAQTLARQLSLVTLRDLVWHFPHGVIDRRHSPPILQLEEGRIASIIATVREHRPPRSGRKIYQVLLENASGQLMLGFFNSRETYLSQLLPPGREVLVSGKVEYYQGVPQMLHPDYIASPDEKDRVMVLEPVYGLTAGVGNRMMRDLATQALTQLPDLPEWHDAALKKQRHWPSWQQAVRCQHDPSTPAEILTAARERLAADELLANQLALALVRQRMRSGRGLLMKSPGRLRADCLNHLPFSLTQGQAEIIDARLQEMASGERMIHLLQGDVGSGKTAVALLLMLEALESGFQAVLMAPTDIVCRQHGEWFNKVLAPLGLSATVLTGADKTASRKQALQKLEDGSAGLIIGTHALFQEKVSFHRLGLVVVDEQHRFGVEQRLALSEKGSSEQGKPHMLLMSATPIPRSLTLTAFGDMDASQLKEKPPGRKPVDTRVMPVARYLELVDGLRRAMAEGARIYWVCPLVDESEQLQDMMSAEQRYHALAREFPGIVRLAHGQMPAAERQQALAEFAEGKAQILVATTVIEVGVNVPEATVMVIEHAERFGLAQLHQLRGRVGRGEHASRCLLLYGPKAGSTALERLKTLRTSDDGFYIAEQDLRLRGGGEILGTRQSGIPDFRFANLYDHRDLIAVMRDDVRLVLHRDPDFSSTRAQSLRRLLYLFEYDQAIAYLHAG